MHWAFCLILHRVFPLAYLRTAHRVRLLRPFALPLVTFFIVHAVFDRVAGG
jgi:hypothetical protein